MLRDLIENAARHGVAAAPVRVTFDGRALGVASRGPVLSAALERRTRPFARESGATLTLLSPAPGETDGVLARLVLP